MHRHWVWGPITLIVGLCGSARAADGPWVKPSPFDGSQHAGFRRWGGLPTAKPTPPPLPATSLAKARATDTAAAIRAQEEANFLRRLAVCDKLRELANQTGDDSLEKQADLLQQKAEAVYKTRTSDPSSSMALADGDKPRGGKR